MTSMKHKTLMARLIAGALTLVLAAGIGMTPAMASSEGPPTFDHDSDDYGGDLGGESARPDGGNKNPGAPQGPRPGDSTSATNTVTVNQAVPGAEYKLYKLLQLEHKDEEYTYTPEGTETPVTAKKIVTYRYSYDATLKDIISAVVALPQFQYAAEADEAGTITHPGYGFKVDGENVVFITPGTDTKGDYTEDDTVKKMMVEFADELRKRIEDTAGLTAVQTQTAAAEGENLTVSFEKVPNGYWMVTSNAGARSIIFTSPEEADISQVVNIDEKNPAPTIEKKVFDADDVAGTVTEDGGSWKDANDVQIGDEVKYKITVELYKGAENIMVYDTMSDGLTFKQVDGVKFYPRKADGTIAESATDGRQVYLAHGGGDTTSELELTGKTDVYALIEYANKHGFVLTFKNGFTNPAAGADNRDEAEAKNNAFLGDLSTLEDDGGRVVIEYTAVLNENAVVGTETGNTNESYVKYGHVPGIDPGEEPPTQPDPADPDPDDPGPDTPPHETPKDETKTYTYEFAIDKFVDGDSATKLAGAEFELRRSFVGIGTAAVEGKSNAYVTDGKLVLPAAEYVIPETGKDAVATIALVDITPENSTSGKVYRVAKLGETGTTNKIVTDATGKITVQGLDSMLYAIKEIKAPTGYNLLEKPVMMAVGSVLSGNGGSVFTEDTTAKREGEDADYSFTKLADTTVGIANASGIQLPRTGGIGTTIFYVLGGTMMVLAAGAGVIMLKKRKDEDAE